MRIEMVAVVKTGTPDRYGKVFGWRQQQGSMPEDFRSVPLAVNVATSTPWRLFHHLNFTT